MEGVNWIQLGMEAIIIIVTVFGAYWKQRVEGEHRMTKMEEMIKTLFNRVDGLGDDHRNMAGKVTSLNSALAELRGFLRKNGNGRVPG